MITLASQPLHRSEADTNGVWQRIINEIPPHDTLMVPCLGHSRVLQNIRLRHIGRLALLTGSIMTLLLLISGKTLN